MHQCTRIHQKIRGYRDTMVHHDDKDGVPLYGKAHPLSSGVQIVIIRISAQTGSLRDKWVTIVVLRFSLCAARY